MSLAKQSDKHPNWLGVKAKYRALHMWVQFRLGKAKVCIVCGENKKRIHWSNIDHKYRRVTEDYEALCAKCHKLKDKKIKLCR